MDLLKRLPRMTTLLVLFPLLTLVLIWVTPESSSADYDLGWLLGSAWLGSGLGWDVLAATLGKVGVIALLGVAAYKAADIWAYRNTLTHTIFTFVGIVVGVEALRNASSTLALAIATVSTVLFGFKATRQWGFYGLMLVLATVIWDFPRAFGLLGFCLIARLLTPVILEVAGIEVKLARWLESSFKWLGLSEEDSEEEQEQEDQADVSVGLTPEKQRQVDRFARLVVIAAAAEVLALGYFGWRALLSYFFGFQALQWYHLAGVTLASTLTIFLPLWGRMVRHQQVEIAGHFASEKPYSLEQIPLAISKLASWAQVIPVSMDCVFAPPGKATELIRWDQWEVYTSSPIKGLVVGLMAMIACLLIIRATQGHSLAKT